MHITITGQTGHTAIIIQEKNWRKNCNVIKGRMKRKTGSFLYY